VPCPGVFQLKAKSRDRQDNKRRLQWSI